MANSLLRVAAHIEHHYNTDHEKDKQRIGMQLEVELLLLLLLLHAKAAVLDETVYGHDAGTDSSGDEQTQDHPTRFAWV